MPSKARVLAVDDNPRNLAILQRCLSNEFNLTLADSGDAALAVAPGLHPEVILLDIMMPGIDGYETCRRLREIPSLAGAKIIMVSAKAMTSERMQGYAAGADDYIIKPFDPDELVAKVRVYARLKSVEEVDQLKSDLLDLLSHETGTPLAGIVGGLSMMRDTPGLSEVHGELLGVAEASTRRLQAFVKRVCLITELKARATPLCLDPIDLRDMAATVIESVREDAEKARIRIVLEQGDPVPTSGDESLLIWAVDALLQNAIRVSPSDAVVSVRAGLDASNASLSVTDHGPGIGPGALPSLFEAFVVSEIKNHSKGTGLSLAAARLIAEHHGGSLSVESEIGRGSVFHLKLALQPAAAVAA